MKNFKYLLMACLAVVLVSCGGKKDSKGEESSDEPIVLKPETTHIKGDLGDYFEVVDRDYTVSNGFGDMVSVEVKRTEVDYAFDLNGVEPFGHSEIAVKANAGFGIEILDENGNVIEKAAATAGGLSGMYSSDDMEEALRLKAGETGTVRWSFHFKSDEKPAKFRLTSAYEETTSTDESVDNSDTDSDFDNSDDNVDESNSSSSASSEDWDALLNSYEQYVDKYISYAKKASKGDMSALEEYPSLMEKAQEFSEKMQNAQGDMSASQWARYIKITNKMTKAAQDLQ